MTQAHCWEDGPLLCKECRAECEYLCPIHPEAGAVSTSCMALQGHDGEHEFCADDLIIISFK
jgi:hypothetical protein